MTLDMPVVILCGGLGTRLRSAVSDRPKALAPVGGKPFLEIQLRLLRNRGARHFVLCVGHMAEQIEATLGDGRELDIRIDYVRDGEQLLGTAGAIKRAEHYFMPAAIVVNGDTYLDLDLLALAQTHAATRAIATLALAHVPDVRQYGLIEHTDQWVTAFREKDPTANNGGWINAGVYVIERRLLERAPSGMPVSLERDVFPAALRDGLRIAAFPQRQVPHDIGTPATFRDFVARQGTVSVS